MVAYHRGAGNWDRFHVKARDRYLHGFEHFFIENAPDFGEMVVNKWPLSDALRDALRNLTDEENDLPYLHIKGVFTAPKPLSNLSGIRSSALAKVAPRHWFDIDRKTVTPGLEAHLKDAHYAIKASALLCAAGTELRPKLTTSNVHRDYLSKPDGSAFQVTQFDDGCDLPRRYRTAMSELTPGADGGRHHAARVILFACIENPNRDPFYLLRASDVAHQFHERELAALREDRFVFFDNWKIAALSRTKPNPKRIFYDSPTYSNAWVSFDPNRLDPECLLAQPDSRNAVKMLLDNVEKLAADDKRAIRIELNRGDALLIDNYRMLVCGTDRGRRRFARVSPPVRWLRAYLGFTKAENGQDRTDPHE